MNYRSVTVFGRAHLVADGAEKMQALSLITDHIVPNRWDEVRGPNELEMKQTIVLALPMQDVAAKVRVGPPADDEADYALPIWAGVVPIQTQLGTPESDGRVLPEVKTVDMSRFALRTAQKSRARVSSASYLAVGS